MMTISLLVYMISRISRAEVSVFTVAIKNTEERHILASIQLGYDDTTVLILFVGFIRIVPTLCSPVTIYL
jgi:hypothetical protein